jgi:hypothetical protein
LAKQISKFWSNQIIKDVYNNPRRHSNPLFHPLVCFYRFALLLSDFFSYLDNCERFADSNYTPLPLDILHCRERTSGVHETSIEIEGLLIRFIDVGGQKAERRKWIDHFSGCTLVIYVTALDSCMSSPLV